ncbi:hypothetical protein [Dyella terrae]|uniref:hypothetical protein n=1 Tax=Dyella terrae TaxID=522259 RepID=UPI001EFE51FB|nr:hypothetical protein [Dyella terrae]ULU26919.1 hypothetical protein DYST_03869 [Dyella terrae]
MRLFKPLLAVVLMAIGTSAIATPFYKFIPYYDNNPFLFCTLGWPADCWAPLNPATGTYVVTDEECFNPVSAKLYTAVCPFAFGK